MESRHRFLQGAFDKADCLCYTIGIRLGNIAAEALTDETAKIDALLLVVDLLYSARKNLQEGEKSQKFFLSKAMFFDKM